MIFKRVENIREVSWKLIHKSIHIDEYRKDYLVKISGQIIGLFEYFSIFDGKIPNENDSLIYILVGIARKGYAKKSVDTLLSNNFDYF